MKRVLAIGSVLAALALLVAADVTYAAGRTNGVVTRHCGSFKYGSDGLPPGPSDIAATGVKCRFARSIAFHGKARGWHCHISVGLTFVCRPVRGHGKVTFLGE